MEAHKGGKWMDVCLWLKLLLFFDLSFWTSTTHISPPYSSTLLLFKSVYFLNILGSYPICFFIITYNPCFFFFLLVSWRSQFLKHFWQIIMMSKEFWVIMCYPKWSLLCVHNPTEGIRNWSFMKVRQTAQDREVIK